MIPDAARFAVDTAIDEALARLAARATKQGESMSALTAAVSTATAGGKRLRPQLVVASFLAVGGDLERAPGLSSVAAAFELLHSAFVIHDDVIDHDVTRRGVPNVAGRFRIRAKTQGADAKGAALLGDAAAILAGDLLLHEATRMVALADVPDMQRTRLLDLLDDAVFVSAAGELADVENSVTPDLAEQAEILAATYNKTAVYSFTAPLCAGAILAGAPSTWIADLERIGGSLGLAFQLVDDLIGAFGTAEQAGKDAGSDLRESKRTPLIALARESAQWPLVTSTLAVAHTGPIAVRHAQSALEASGARERLHQLIAENLSDVRRRASRSTLPPRAVTLADTLAAAVEERIP
ncbi:MAG TPA: geranylgeranyl pyrophosphate synthase [Microbacterium sp.]|uniref:polyprenyl synthetase family protein n=1 Tax=unclassified Microbacterium TaxID=2609290 RepID=UPI000C6B6347|nr:MULTISPECIES: polyprenyl synthetase family protein [unclassified Microbacterium]MBU18787.1 geranylgeranyl pyrophosphate synthase [Microbacterium sp.]HBS07803.1 geranylgeranyl pyrophosphate synthase [Microbacterium sp.]|tara:strand:- start:1386 stop:2441 length:1056 start_codon:yes stop_codon:yes gene_type:complete